MPAMAVHSADSSLGNSLCAVLKKLVPEVKTYKPGGAGAQLVMAVSEKFDYDAAKLRQVKAEVDKATTVSCPKDCEAMFGIPKDENARRSGELTAEMVRL
jgi:hypothetical protein